MFGGVFDSASIESKIKEKEALTEAPDFWDDHSKAEKVMASIRKLRNRIEPWKTLLQEYDDLIASGGSIPGKLWAGLTGHIGETKGQTYTRYLNNLEQIDKYKKSMQDAADEFKDVKSAKDAWQQMTQWKGESLADYKARKQAAYLDYKTLQKNAIDAAISKSNTFVDAAGNTYTMNADDMLYAEDIRATIGQANRYVESHSVQYWDGTKYEKFKEIKTRDDLGNASDAAHKTRTHITDSPDYNKAIANDKAAGINSNSSGKK